MVKKYNNCRKLLFFSFVLLSLMAGHAWAFAPGVIISSEVHEGELVLYIENPGEIQNIQCQVGTKLCDEISYGPVTDQEVSVSTLLLIDNSLSVASRYRPMINEIMNNLAANRIPGERITVATFSDKITYLLEDSSDYAQIKQCIDGITYEDQETYLTDVLYELLMDWKQVSKPGYKRIILVSDGVDNKAVGYTKEELYSLLKEAPCPVYTIGCTHTGSDNNEELKNMFALSRLTQASSWLLDDISDSMTVVSDVAKDNDVWRVKVTLPVEVCDGTSKGIKLSISAGGTAMESVTAANMPFSIEETEQTAEETTKVTPTETVLETKADKQEEEIKPAAGFEVSQEQKKMVVYIVIAGIAALAGAAVLVVLLRLHKNKKDEHEFETAPDDAYLQANVQSSLAFDKAEATELVSDAGKDHTAMVWGNQEQTYTLILTDLNNLTRRFEVPLAGPVLIGRSSKEGCQIVLDYDKSVSRRHCQIRLDGSQMKIKDINARNTTILNGKKIVGETVLHSGSILTLGNLKMKVELH